MGFYENYLIGRKRKDRRTGSKGIGGFWHEIVKVGHKLAIFQVEIENAKCQEAYQASARF